MLDVMFGESTNDSLRRHKDEIRLDPEIESLVFALNDTGVVSTTYSCEGHFVLVGNVPFCHHNQKAQIHFYILDLPKAAALCDEVLRNIVLDELEISVKQVAVRGEDDLEIQWILEYRPIGFWEMRPQDEGMYIGMSPNWTQEKVRGLLRKAFHATIEICKSGQWKA